MAIGEKLAKGQRLQMRKGISEQAEIIAPFQYYTEAGEAIYAFDSEQGRRGYLHTDAEGRKLAQLNAGIEILNSVALSDLDAQEASFSMLMHEMHAAAQSDSELLFEKAEFDHLRAISRNEPILIGGCGRSGTTLLLAVLGAHSDILAMPEEMYAFYPFPFRLSGLVNFIEEHEREAWQHWCEKTPKNVRAFADIFAAFDGQVKLIHIVRDGRDVVTSHHPNAEERYYISPERWVEDVRTGWAHREKTLLMRYEDLVTKAQATLEMLCDFLEIEFDQRMLAFERHSSVTENKAWDGGAARAMNSAQVARWQAPEHRERVAEFLATPGASEMMALLDYV